MFGVPAKMTIIGECLKYWNDYYNDPYNIHNLSGGEMLEYLNRKGYLNTEKLKEDFGLEEI